MLGVNYAEPKAVRLGDPMGAPEPVEPAVGHGSPPLQRLGLPDKLAGEPGLWARVRLGGKGLGGLLGYAEPSIQRDAADAKDASEGGAPAIRRSRWFNIPNTNGRAEAFP